MADGTQTGGFAFDNSYARLPERFHARLPPEPVSAPTLLALNEPLARLLGADPDLLRSAEGVAWLGGATVPPGAEPLAMVYAGHQFGGWSPRLGDGRAILLGEVIGADGVRRDVQLKGSGPTPFSRMGDGRAALGPVLREFLVSEAMAALGVPTTRALAAVATGETVWREGPQRGAVLTRVARAHIRVGTFQYFAGREDVDALRTLADYARSRLHPEAADGPLGLLQAVIAAQAALVAQWMGLGFIHGVMNTDNMAISGETIDYGPCAFMDAYDPATVYSAIDRGGRYAWGNQPGIAHWNLAKLAQALLPILDDDPDAALAKAQAAVDAFPDLYRAAWLGRLRAKLGMAGEEPGDQALADALLDLMRRSGADFTGAFRRLCDAAEGDDAPLVAALGATDDAALWLHGWRARLSRQERPIADTASAMRRANPRFIPRNHRVAQALEAAEQGDLAPFERLRGVLASPFDDQPGHDDLALPPSPGEEITATFCGT